MIPISYSEPHTYTNTDSRFLSACLPEQILLEAPFSSEYDKDRMLTDYRAAIHILNDPQVAQDNHKRWNARQCMLGISDIVVEETTAWVRQKEQQLAAGEREVCKAREEGYATVEGTQWLERWIIKLQTSVREKAKVLEDIETMLTVQREEYANTGGTIDPVLLIRHRLSPGPAQEEEEEEEDGETMNAAAHEASRRLTPEPVTREVSASDQMRMETEFKVESSRRSAIWQAYTPHSATGLFLPGQAVPDEEEGEDLYGISRPSSPRHDGVRQSPLYPALSSAFSADQEGLQLTASASTFPTGPGVFLEVAPPGTQGRTAGPDRQSSPIDRTTTPHPTIGLLSRRQATSDDEEEEEKVSLFSFSPPSSPGGYCAGPPPSLYLIPPSTVSESQQRVQTPAPASMFPTGQHMGIEVAPPRNQRAPAPAITSPTSVRSHNGRESEEHGRLFQGGLRVTNPDLDPRPLPHPDTQAAAVGESRGFPDNFYPNLSWDSIVPESVQALPGGWDPANWPVRES